MSAAVAGRLVHRGEDGLRGGPRRPGLQRPPARPVPGRRSRGCRRGRRRGRRPARRRARLEGQRPLRRSLVGGVEPARRRTADRPRPPALVCPTTTRPASSRPARPRRARSSWSPSSPSAAGPSPVGTARPSASAASCCRAARAGTVGPRAGPARASSRSTWSPPTASWSAPTPSSNTDLYWAARGAGPGFPGIVTCFHLQTYEKPAAMWQDTWTFHLDDAERVVHWLHEVLPRLDRRVEPVLAATRLPDVPLYDGVAHPGGTLLLLHTTCMADSDEEAQRLLGGAGGVPRARARAGPRHRSDLGGRGERRADRAEPGGPPLRRRLRLDRRAGRGAGAAADGHLARPGHASTRSRSGTAGRRPARCPTWRSRSRATSTSRRT